MRFRARKKYTSSKYYRGQKVAKDVPKRRDLLLNVRTINLLKPKTLKITQSQTRSKLNN